MVCRYLALYKEKERFWYWSLGMSHTKAPNRMMDGNLKKLIRIQKHFDLLKNKAKQTDGKTDRQTDAPSYSATSHNGASATWS